METSHFPHFARKWLDPFVWEWAFGLDFPTRLSLSFVITNLQLGRLAQTSVKSRRTIQSIDPKIGVSFALVTL